MLISCGLLCNELCAAVMVWNPPPLQMLRCEQVCFDRAVEKLEKEKFKYQAAELKEAMVHWLRHIGISDDVKIRPREHVRDDAGHSSSLITDRYIDIDSRERHSSAKSKTLRD